MLVLVDKDKFEAKKFLPLVANSVVTVNAAGDDISLTPMSAGMLERVEMPANTAANGAVGEFAVNGDEFAIYVDSVGWIFFTGVQK